MVKRSKKYREAAERVDRNNLYTANEAIALLKSMPSYNFDQTVEAGMKIIAGTARSMGITVID